MSNIDEVVKVIRSKMVELIDQEFEVECFSGTYRLKPKRLFILYGKITRGKRKPYIVAYFQCPEGYPVFKKVAEVDVIIEDVPGID